VGLISLLISTGIQVGFYGILAARRLALIPEELDTGRIRNPGGQRLVALSFGVLLLVFLLESLLLSIPSLPLSTRSSTTAAQEPAPELQVTEPSAGEVILPTEDSFVPESYFNGEQILVWTRPLAAFLIESEHFLYVFEADGSGVELFYNQPVSAEDSPAPQLSPDGGLWIVRSKRTGEYQQYLMTVDGSRTYQLLYQNAPVTIADWSPDNSQILVVSETAGQGDVLITDRDGQDWQILANSGANEIHPLWSPSGEQILYQTDQDGNQEIYLVSPSGGNLVNLTQHPAEDIQASWIRNGTRILFTSDRDGVFGIYHIKPDGSDLQAIAQDPTCGFTYQLSPNGETLLYTTDPYYQSETHGEGQDECKLTTRTLVSLSSGNPFPLEVDPDSIPEWSPDGSKLVFYGPRDIDSGEQGIYTIQADGFGLADITPPVEYIYQTTWSADSSQLALVESVFSEGEGSSIRLSVVNSDGSDRRELAPIPWGPEYAFAYKGFFWP
jgi:Tol biopolymer transport system component